MMPWLLIGAAVLGALLATGAHQLGLHRHRRSREHRHNGICVYLHEKNVMNVYLQGDFEALKQDIEEQTRTDTGKNVEAKFGGVHGRAGRDAERQKVIRSTKEAGPITVLSRIVEDREHRGGIVHVDLVEGVLEAGPGLKRALRTSRVDEVRLSELNSFALVSVTGRFRVTDRTNDTVTLSACFGESAGSDGEPVLTVICEQDHILAELPSVPFSARCLGQVQGWHPTTARLVLEPLLAIYR